VRLWKCHNAW